jgi:tRNA(Arg) A34 adenosine deaminase TadA
MAFLKDSDYLKRAVELSKKAFNTGNEPFGALLVGPDGEIIMEQGNAVGLLKDHTAHDAMTLASRASKKYDADFLWECTLYATIEPCFMCLGGIFWANIGKVKYAMAESELNRMFGGDPLVAIHTEQINKHLGKDIKIFGPFEELVPEVKPVIQNWLSNLGIG